MLLRKISTGDRAAIKSLSTHLADRLLHVPILKQESGGHGNITKLTVLQLDCAGRTALPIFTSERSYRQWRMKSEHEVESFALLGADICLAVGTELPVVVDPEGQFPVLLEPDEVELVAKAPLPEEFDLEAERVAKQSIAKAHKAEAAKPAEAEQDLAASVSKEDEAIDEVLRGIKELEEKGAFQSKGAKTFNPHLDGHAVHPTPAAQVAETAPQRETKSPLGAQLVAELEQQDEAQLESASTGSAAALEVKPTRKPIVIPSGRRRRKTQLDLLRPELDPELKRIRNVDEEADAVTSTVVVRSSVTVGENGEIILADPPPGSAGFGFKADESAPSSIVPKDDGQNFEVADSAAIASDNPEQKKVRSWKDYFKLKR